MGRKEGRKAGGREEEGREDKERGRNRNCVTVFALSLSVHKQYLFFPG